MRQWSIAAPAAIVGQMAKSANRRIAPGKVARANEARSAKTSKPRKERETEEGPFEPLRINYFCKKLGVSHEVLAERTGYSVEYISQQANGRRRFNQELLDAFAHAFGISRAALLPLEEGDPIGEFGSMTREEQQRFLRIGKAATEAAN